MAGKTSTKVRDHTWHVAGVQIGDSTGRLSSPMSHIFVGDLFLSPAARQRGGTCTSSSRAVRRKRHSASRVSMCMLHWLTHHRGCPPGRRQHRRVIARERIPPDWTLVTARIHHDHILKPSTPPILHHRHSASAHSSPEQTPSTHSTSLLTVVRFSAPFSVTSTQSSMRTPPMPAYFASTAWSTCLLPCTRRRRCGWK
jgi:hypothetical protein